jgi:hypothetical protein
MLMVLGDWDSLEVDRSRSSAQGSKCRFLLLLNNLLLLIIIVNPVVDDHALSLDVRVAGTLGWEGREHDVGGLGGHWEWDSLLLLLEPVGRGRG